MAAPTRARLFTMINRLPLLFNSNPLMSLCRKCTQLLSNKQKLFICASVITASVSKNNEEEIKDIFKGPDPSSLSKVQLIKNASSAAIDSTLTLYNQSVSAICDAEKEYAEAVYTVVSLMEHHLTILRNEYEVTQVWDSILEAREQMNERKRQKRDLEFLYSAVERMVLAAGEAAFITGAEYASMAASERLSSGQNHIDRVRTMTRDAERALQEMEVTSINKISQHAKQQVMKAAAVAENETASIQIEEGPDGGKTDEEGPEGGERGA